MQAKLKRQVQCYHFVNGEKIAGVHTGLRGDVTDLRGDVTGLRGDVTGLRGDVDDCDIEINERKNGIAVALLVGAS